MTVETIPVPAHILLAREIRLARVALERADADVALAMNDAQHARARLERLETMASK